MADTEERVVYSYEGDVSSLRQATDKALNLLNRYQKQINRISADGGFGKSTKAAKSFQNQINATTKQVTAMQNQLKKVSDVQLFSSDKITQDLSTSLGSINRVLNSLSSSSKLSTKEVQALTSQLKLAKQGFIDNSAAVTTLVQKEARWQQTLDGVRTKTTQARDTLDTLKSRVTSVFDPMISKMNALSAPLQSLTSRLQSYKDKASETFGKISQLASTVASAFRRVSTSEGDTEDVTNRVTSSHLRLRNILTDIQSAFKKETKYIDDEQDSLKEKNDTLNQSTRNHTNLLNILVNLGNVFLSESNQVNIFNTRLRTLTSSTNILKRAFTGLAGISIGSWFADSIRQSISYVENLNLFTVAMGEAYDEGMEFVGAMSELYGMDPSNLMRYAGNFYQLSDAIDMPSEAAASLSLGLTKAANDIASLFNVDIETVFENLSSGMQGMSRAVRKYGMDIRTTTLQQTALSLGITESVENMTEANRQGLRFITMMRQASNASGDFANTIETPANQLRIFKEQITQLGRAIGDFFIKPLATAIAYVNGFIMALRMILQFIGSIFGVVNKFFGGSSGSKTENTINNVTDGVSGVGSAAKEATDELEKMLAPFDELNLLQEPQTDFGAGGGGGALSDLGTLDPAILAAIEEMQWKLDEVEMKAVKVRNAILAFLGFKVEDGTILSWDSTVFEENLINKFPQWTNTIKAVFDNWTSIVDGFKAVFKSMGEVLVAVWDKTINFIKKFINDKSVSTFIQDLGTNLQNLANWISNNADLLANFVIALSLFRNLQPIISILSSVVTWLTNMSNVLPGVTTAVGGVSASMLGWVAGIAIVAVSLADLLVTNEEFRDTVGNAWESLITLIKNLWNSLLKPILSSLKSTISDIYQDTIKPIVEQISTILLTLWSDILQPILSWLITALGPSVADIVKDILNVVVWLVNNLGGLIRSLLQIIQGIIDFVAGVFTGDWSRAWQGIVNVFAGLFNAVGSIVVAVMNAVITVINGAISAIYNAVVSVINLIAGMINTVAGMLGFTLQLGISAQAPQISYFKAPTLAMANGGVVTSPTNALIGEGKYDEAVVPLGNSPQMRQFADSVAARVNSGEQLTLLREQNELLKQILDKTGVSLDGKMLTDVVTEHQRRRSRATGV